MVSGKKKDINLGRQHMLKLTQKVRTKNISKILDYMITSKNIISGHSSSKGTKTIYTLKPHSGTGNGNPLKQKAIIENFNIMLKNLLETQILQLVWQY